MQYSRSVYSFLQYFDLEAVGSILLSPCSHVPVFCCYPGSDPLVNFASFSSVLITESREQDDAPLPSSPGGGEETCTCLPAVPRGSALTPPLYPSARWSFSSAPSGETKTQTRVYVCLQVEAERGKEKYVTVGNTFATKPFIAQRLPLYLVKKNYALFFLKFLNQDFWLQTLVSEQSLWL